MNVEAALRKRLARPVTLLNDADAAGLAEMRWGAARGVRGTVMVLTFGTGIGSALFTDGRLVPNTELGHMEVDGFEGEQRASARARTAEGLDWPQWTERVNRYLDAINRLFWPELIVIGGGVSENYNQFAPLLRSRAPLRVATLGASAGGGGRSHGRVGARCVSQRPSKLPDVGTTIFTVISRRAEELGAVNLGQGFPDYPIDPLLTELVSEAMRAGFNQYAPMAGVPALMEQIAVQLQRRHGLAVDPQREITITLGATEAIFSAIAALAGPGDEVLVFDPAYDSYDPRRARGRRALRARAAAATAVPLRLGSGARGGQRPHPFWSSSTARTILPAP